MTLIRRASVPPRSVSAFRTLRDAAQVIEAKQPETAEDPREQQLARLREECDMLARQVETLRTDAENARLEGYEEGRAAGRDEAERRDAERLTQLESALVGARNDLVERLSEERDLAIEIALAALRRAIGDPAHYRELVTATARHHAAALERGAMLQLAVSPADFADSAALAELQAAMGQIRIELDPELAPGGCRFDLTLGQLEAHIPVQAVALEALLIESTGGTREHA